MAGPSSSIAEKTPAEVIRTKHLFSCDSCYRRKVRCDRANPCSYCARHAIECRPSGLATTERPRKRRFPESELLRRIRKYEAALVRLGADPEAIRNGEEDDGASLPASTIERRADLRLSDAALEPEGERLTFEDGEVFNSVFSTLDGEEEHDAGNLQKGERWYDRIFKNDTTSSMLFAVDSPNPPPHPEPFDMLKLWQVYCENVHPTSKFLHAPSFQRLISSYGSLLHVAPPSDQALFFSVYLAAVTSLSTEECEAMFYATKKFLLEQYTLATQVWLSRAGLWRSSELPVLQAFVLFLASLQNTSDPRPVAAFTALADRVARRMGLHRSSSSSAQGMYSPVEQEVRVRLWWELIFLDSKVVERTGLGTAAMMGNWSVRLPWETCDADLDTLNVVQHGKMRPTNGPPSSEMLFFLVRAEAACFLAKVRNQRSAPPNASAHNGSAALEASIAQQLKAIDELEDRLQSRYLSLCDRAIPHHRLTLLFAAMLLSRIRMSACVAGSKLSGKQGEANRSPFGLALVQHCSSNVDAFCRMRNDSSLARFQWLLMQNLPIVAYILLLRLLQTHVSGDEVDKAWQAVEAFKSLSSRLVVDSLILKAWQARKAASLDASPDPPFITEIYAKASTASKPHIIRDDVDTPSSSAHSSDNDFLALMSEILMGEANNDFVGPAWLE